MKKHQQRHKHRRIIRRLHRQMIEERDAWVRRQYLVNLRPVRTTWGGYLEKVTAPTQGPSDL